MAAIFCFHPFESSTRELAPAVRVLKSLGYGSKLPVENLFVATPGDTHLSLAFDQPIEVRYTLFPHRELNLKSKALWGMTAKAKSQVIFDDVRSLRKAVLRLDNYAASAQSELVCVTTSMKKTLARWFLGSFTETLLDTSRRNLLVVPGAFKGGGKIRRILFSTDLGPTDLKQLPVLLKWAAAQKVQVHLFHVPEPILTLPAGMSSDARRQAEARFRKASTQLAKLVPPGLALQFKVSKTSIDVASQILKQAKKMNVDMIVMNSKASSMEKIILGSVVKSVMRRTKAPVLVLRDPAALFPEHNR